MVNPDSRVSLARMLSLVNLARQVSRPLMPRLPVERPRREFNPRNPVVADRADSLVPPVVNPVRAADAVIAALEIPLRAGLAAVDLADPAAVDLEVPAASAVSAVSAGWTRKSCKRTSPS